LEIVGFEEGRFWEDADRALKGGKTKSSWIDEELAKDQKFDKVLASRIWDEILMWEKA